MKTNFESRFMEVATAGVPCQMTKRELNAEFNKFQNEMLEVLMSDIGYLAIDYILNDLLAQLDGIVCGKKMNTFAHSSSGQKPISAPALPRTKNA